MTSWTVTSRFLWNVHWFYHTSIFDLSVLIFPKSLFKRCAPEWSIINSYEHEAAVLNEVIGHSSWVPPNLSGMALEQLQADTLPNLSIYAHVRWRCKFGNLYMEIRYHAAELWFFQEVFVSFWINRMPFWCGNSCLWFCDWFAFWLLVNLRHGARNHKRSPVSGYVSSWVFLWPAYFTLIELWRNCTW